MSNTWAPLSMLEGLGYPRVSTVEWIILCWRKVPKRFSKRAACLFHQKWWVVPLVSEHRWPAWQVGILATIILNNEHQNLHTILLIQTNITLICLPTSSYPQIIPDTCIAHRSKALPLSTVELDHYQEFFISWNFISDAGVN